LKRNDEALADFDYAVSLAPDRGEAYRRRGLHYMVTKSDYDRSMADFDRAIRAEPDLGYGYRLKGLLLWHLKKYDDADRVFTAGIQRDIYFSNTYYSRATMNEERGRKTQAIADFKKALERNPRHRAAREALTRLGSTP
jgi:tetratricopeptide (TPR) repeat protein